MVGREFAQYDSSAYSYGLHDGQEGLSSGLGYDDAPSGNQQVASQPILLLIVAMLSVIMSLGLLYFRWDSKPANVAAWVLAGPIAITCLGLFLGADARRRAATVYYTKVWSGWAYRVIAVAAIAASAGASWAMAQWLVRL